jgi:2-(1,2-epoxy-1,2-dihydrophenyl)acetyl-CoA isomerase
VPTNDPPVSYDLAGRVATLTLRGDDAHALDLAGVTLLYDAVRRARREGAAVVLLSAEGRFFSAGGDVRAFAAADDLATTIEGIAGVLHATVTELVRMDAVVVAAVQGVAAGAGFPLVAAADLVLAGESAQFTLGYTKIGLTIDGGSSMLVATLGLHRTLRLALLNDVLTADEALAAGLVARVFPDDELASAASALVARLAAGPPEALARTKRVIRDLATPSPESALHREAEAIRRQAATADAREGVAAFVEKRPPRFGGPA